MVELNQEQIQVLVDAVAQKLAGGMRGTGASAAGSPSFRFPPSTNARATPAAVAMSSSCSVAYPDLDTAVAVAKKAQAQLIALPMEKRKAIIAKVREALRAHVQELSRL